MYCIVPLAGPDFYNESYGIKPLYEINGQPLLKAAISSRDWYRKGDLTNENIIWILKDTLKSKEVEDLIITDFTGSKVVKLSDFTQGALFSALAGGSLIDNFNVPVIVDLVDIIYRSDFSPNDIFNKETDVDGILPYFTSSNEKYSYMKILDGYVSETAEKKPISRNASAGTYIFRNFKVFLDAVSYSVKEEKKVTVNNVFYLCPAFNAIVEKGRKIVPVGVEDVNELSLEFH